MCFVVFVAYSNTVTVAFNFNYGSDYGSDWLVAGSNPSPNLFLLSSQKCFPLSVPEMSYRSGSDGLFLEPGGALSTGMGWARH